jgi:hypothetical protein
MVPSYWQHDWFLTGWFPPVWFAPADESGVPEEELRPEYYGGGGKPLGESNEARTRLFREHHDYLDGLREIQVQISDDVRGSRTISIPASMPVPDEILPPAMRGKVPVLAADVFGNAAIIAMLALLIDEADE